MLYQLKQSAIDTVSQKIGQTICDKTFQNYTKIDGEQLISLTNSRQVNSFIIRSLFNQWRKEVEKLESPYFDFKHEKVQEALKNFMNLLSNHISIDRHYLQPILNQAISDTILISFEPKAYLESVLDRVEKPQDFKLEFKYIKTNRELFKNLVERIGDFDTKASIIQSFESLNGSEFEKIDAPQFLEKLNSSALLNELFEAKEEPNPEPQPEPVETPNVAEVVNNQRESEEKNASTLNERFEQSTKGQTLAEKLQRKVNKSLESSLTLNEKFMFQNNLFHGDNAKMRSAFAAIDQANSLQEALDQANSFNDGWDMDSEEVEAFMSVLERRFA